MIRVLFILIILFLVFYVVLRLKKTFNKSQINEAKPCRICGSYVLKNEAIVKNDKTYCSIECFKKDNN